MGSFLKVDPTSVLELCLGDIFKEFVKGYKGLDEKDKEALYAKEILEARKSIAESRVRKATSKGE